MDRIVGGLVVTSVGNDVRSLLVQLDEPDFPYWEFYQFQRWARCRERWILLIRTDAYLANTRGGWEERGPDIAEADDAQMIWRSPAEVVELTAEMRVIDSGLYTRRPGTPLEIDEHSVSVNSLDDPASVDRPRMARGRRGSLALVNSTERFVSTR